VQNLAATLVSIDPAHVAALGAFLLWRAAA
jgi:hypothetical protein